MTEDAAPHQTPPPGSPAGFTAFEPGTNAPREAEELLEATVGPVQADTVHLERSSAASVAAARVTMRQSSAQRVDGGSMQLSRSAAGLVRTTDLALHDSAVGALSTSEARVVDSAVGALRAGSVVAEGRTTILLNLGATPDGATTVVSREAALRLGGALALTLLVVGRAFRLVVGRSRQG